MKGQELYKKAKKIIPGGTMLLSKRPEMFLPDNWPSYFSKAKGCFVWDLDKKKYTDMSIMGIGTNTLGYGHDEVDSAVINTIHKGNMSTFSCPEEVYLAEKLIEINDWADSVRFCRAGGEANALAIRIARAASGKDKVAICGYHGWHDWYLSVNHNSLNGLDDHLLPGLKPKGVPKNLKDTVYPFTYNDYEQLLDICDNNDIGVIKMEVIRNFGPENDFLQKVRDLATQRGIVLVFDECTSGFRETFGGIHKKFSVNPDIAMFGKTIGNGYALTAVVGVEEVMKSVEDTFISSTFWTERIGPTAALKTLEVMKDIESWKIITDIGLKVRNNWSDLFHKYNIEFDISGIPSLSSYTFKNNDLEIQTLITQEMLKKGFLASNRFYACIAHNDELLDSYFNAFDETLSTISIIKDDKNEIIDRLTGPVRHSGFKRLN
jgi:glutamate-1-semialdehyde aminotransferase